MLHNRLWTSSVQVGPTRSVLVQPDHLIVDGPDRPVLHLKKDRSDWSSKLPWPDRPTRPNWSRSRSNSVGPSRTQSKWTGTVQHCNEGNINNSIDGSIDSMEDVAHNMSGRLCSNRSSSDLEQHFDRNPTTIDPSLLDPILLEFSL